MRLAAGAEGCRRSPALVAAVLFVPLVALRTDVGPAGSLILRSRWLETAILCGLVVAGRLALVLLDRPRRAAAQRRRRRPGPTGSQAGRLAAPALLVLAVLLPLLPGDRRYELDLGILVLTYVMLGWGLNIVVGLAGLLDLGYVAFYAVGAYSYALLAHDFRPVLLGLPAAGRDLRRLLRACCSASRCCGCAATTWPS